MCFTAMISWHTMFKVSRLKMELHELESTSSHAVRDLKQSLVNKDDNINKLAALIESLEETVCRNQKQVLKYNNFSFWPKFCLVYKN